MKNHGALKYDAKKYQLSGFYILMELIRPWLLLAVYIICALQHWWWVAIPLAVATIFAAFVQMHDSIHNALNLPAKLNSFVLGMCALLILKSGHGAKVTHLRHHGQCLSENDPEGAPANWELKQVFLNGPYHVFTMRFASLKISPNTKFIQLFETLLTLLLLIGFVVLYLKTGIAAGLVYWGVAFVLSALMPLWASYIPHKISLKNPTRLIGVGLSRIWTPIISSFAFHHLHHCYPKIPTALLPKAALELEYDEEHEH